MGYRAAPSVHEYIEFERGQDHRRRTTDLAPLWFSLSRLNVSVAIERAAVAENVWPEGLIFRIEGSGLRIWA